MNTCYKHFYFFVTSFKLVDSKELEPLVRINRKYNHIYLFVYMCFHLFIYVAMFVCL